MSLQILCPSCNDVTEWHRAPVTTCSRCGLEYPNKLRVASDSALRRSAAPKPMLLVIGQFFSAFAGGLWAIFLILAPFDVGTYSINGVPVSGPEFLRRAGILTGALTIGLLAIAVGLWRERTWSRPLMLLYWLTLPIIAATGDGGVSDLLEALSLALICGGVAAWYLYRRPNVRAYFEARASEREMPE